MADGDAADLVRTGSLGVVGRRGASSRTRAPPILTCCYATACDWWGQRYGRHCPPEQRPQVSKRAPETRRPASTSCLKSGAELLVVCDRLAPAAPSAPLR